MGREPDSTGTRDFSGFPVTTTSVTATIGRPPRKFYFIVQAAAFLATLGVALAAEECEALFGKMNVPLPVSSELLVSLGRFLRNPVGLSCIAAMVLGLGLLAFKGVLDGILKALIWFNVLWIVGVAAVYLLGGILPLKQLLPLK